MSNNTNLSRNVFKIQHISALNKCLYKHACRSKVLLSCFASMCKIPPCARLSAFLSAAHYFLLLERLDFENNDKKFFTKNQFTIKL